LNLATPDLNARVAPDRVIKTDDYPFETLPAFCKDISTPLKFIQEKNTRDKFKMNNPESRKFYYGSPLFIVDQQVTRDVDYLSNLEFQQLDSIYLYYDNQKLTEFFGFAGFSGVVVINSKRGDLEVPNDLRIQEFSIGGLQPEIVKHENQPSELPRLNPLLLWEPSLNTNQNGQAGFSFVQSDDISIYQIEVVAQSSDGKRGYGKLEYRSHRTF
jgi:hypothetical protein